MQSSLDNHPLPLAIQEELVDQQKSIDETAAGKELDKRVIALVSQLEEKIKLQLENADAARRRADEQTKKELLEESVKNQAKILELQKEVANNAKLYQEMQDRFRKANTDNSKAVDVQHPVSKKVKAQTDTLDSITSGRGHTMRMTSGHCYYAILHPTHKAGKCCDNNSRVARS